MKNQKQTESKPKLPESNQNQNSTFKMTHSFCGFLQILPSRQPHPGLLHFVASGHWLSLRRSRLQPSSLLQNICFDEDRYKRLILGKNPDEKGRMNILTNCVQIWIRFQNSFQDLQTFGHFKSDKTHPLSLTVDGKFHLDPPFSRKSIIQKHPNWHADTYPLQGTNISHFRELTYPTTAHSCFQLPLDGIF